MKNLQLSAILATTFAYTYLFYEEMTGINYLVFDFLLLLFLTALDVNRQKHPAVLVTATGLLLSGAAVFLHNSIAAVLLHWLSFGLYVRFYYHPNFSPYLALMEQALETVVSVFKVKIWKEVTAHTNTKSWLMYVLLLPVVVLFLILYASGNALYNSWMKELLDFDLNFGILFFIASGLALSFSVYVPAYSRRLQASDWLCRNNITLNKQANTLSWIFGTLTNECKAAIFLLGILNLVTLSFHASEIYLFVKPEFLHIENYSEYIHEGVNSLIVSIVLAIAIVLYFLRGQLNFQAGSTTVKVLTYAWMAQNLLLVMTTLHRNALYIEAHGLTHKRIGVFVWLLIVAIGILLTLYKVKKDKSTWFLLRANSWSVYVVLVVYGLFNWDRTIISHNFSNPQKSVDYSYYEKLNDSAIAEMVALSPQNPSLKQFYHVNDALIRAQKHALSYKEAGWPSYSMENERIAATLLP